LRALRSYLQEVAFSTFSISLSRAKHAGFQHEKYVLRRFLHEFQIDCVFDVGANAGQYGRLLRSIGYRGPIVSFEPIPELAKALEIESGKDGNWSVEPVALDEVSREVTFNVMAGSQFSSIKTPKEIDADLLDEANRTVKTITLTTALLSEYFDEYKSKYKFSRPFLKIDAQGADLAVARGAGSRLTEFVGVQTELSVRPIYEDQPLLSEALDFFDRNGFAVCAFLPTHDHFPILVEVDSILVNRTKLAGVERRPSLRG